MIELIEITKVYGTGNSRVKALQDISLRIANQEFVAIMGPSGSGKSTLLNIIGCLDTVTTGTYLLEHADVAGLSLKEKARLRNEVFGFVFQSFNLVPEISALDNVIMPLKYSRVPRKQWKSLAEEALQMMGLSQLARRLPDQLSGGQQQRVAIARALVNGPKVILADEPTGNLDSATSREIVQVLRDLVTKHEKTVIVVTHDGSIASQGDRLIQMVDGMIVEDSPIDQSSVEFTYPSL